MPGLLGHQAKRMFDHALDCNPDAWVPVGLALLKLRLKQAWTDFWAPRATNTADAAADASSSSSGGDSNGQVGASASDAAASTSSSSSSLSSQQQQQQQQGAAAAKGGVLRRAISSLSQWASSQWGGAWDDFPLRGWDTEDLLLLASSAILALLVFIRARRM